MNFELISFLKMADTISSAFVEILYTVNLQNMEYFPFSYILPGGLAVKETADSMTVRMVLFSENQRFSPRSFGLCLKV